MKIVKQLPRIKPRRADTHKGDYGKVLLIAGSKGMSGAAYLSAQSSIRSGAGLVYLATPSSQQPILSSKLACVITHPLAETPAGTISRKALKEMTFLLENPTNRHWNFTFNDIDAVGIGPGLSRHPQTMEFVRSILPILPCPTVIDADGINALIDNHQILKKMRTAIMTPHAGEMARLLGTTATKIQFNRLDSAIETSRKLNAIIVLKGHKTIVTDGENVYINTTGNPGMATAGSGDVLTGMLVGFLGQKFSPFEASQLAVYLHGLSGDIAVKKSTEPSLIATDILDSIPDAFTRIIHPDLSG
ncbi:MAG: NAD(P)H-hydrate dehydratase [Planctomycetota bacterium]|nr:NAD(P)H-hydrate dehydratase [Planctomycetota bacterium]